MVYLYPNYPLPYKVEVPDSNCLPKLICRPTNRVPSLSTRAIVGSSDPGGEIRAGTRLALSRERALWTRN
jgi:hypothetical protein